MDHVQQSGHVGEHLKPRYMAINGSAWGEGDAWAIDTEPGADMALGSDTLEGCGPPLLPIIPADILSCRAQMWPQNAFSTGLQVTYQPTGFGAARSIICHHTSSCWCHPIGNGGPQRPLK